MKKGSIYFFIVGSFALLLGCSPKVQTFDLNDEYATSLHYEGTDINRSTKSGGGLEDEKSELAGVPAKNFYGGDLKRGGIWWAGKNITLEKGDIFTFDAENVGPDTIPFGATFPPLDLVKEPLMVKISARAIGANGSTPTLYFEADDAEGYKANAKWPSQKIENSEDFKDYYFELKGMFVQSIPKKHSVNGAMISSVKFFINPGQPGFTGQILIREIKVVPVVKP